MLLILALQVAAQTAPDIELNVHATVREVRVRQSGETSLTVRASPDANSGITLRRPEGRQRGRGATIDVHAEARIADPAQGNANNVPPPETPRPQSR